MSSLRGLLQDSHVVVRRATISIVLIIVLSTLSHWLTTPVYGQQLGNRSLNVTSNQASAETLYTVNFNFVNTSIVGSIQIQFCSNGPFPQDVCIAPAGLDTTPAVLTNQSGVTGFSISNASDANTIILTRLAALPTSNLASFSFSPVTNPSTPGSYYVRIQTFATTDASGTSSDYGAIAYAITNQLSISATVPPYLLFCTGITVSGLNCANAVGDYIDFGEFSSTQASHATSQMLVATNAEQGYAISIAGTTLTSGNNIINALATDDVSRPGTSQFGFNLKANTTPSGGSEVAGPGTSVPTANYALANNYRFVPGETVVSDPITDDIRVFTSSYLANVPSTQAPGIYVSTVTYICLANF